MKISKNNHILTVTIMFGLLVMILVSIVAGFILNGLSYSVAQANPELQFLRVPFLIICLVLIGVFVINLILAEMLLVNIMRNSIFTESNVRLLKLVSWLFIVGILPFATLYIMTEIYVGGSITQVYVIFFGVVFLTAGLIFRLWANLISDASQFKQEVDMTV